MKPSVRALYPAPGPDVFVGLGGDVEVRALSTLDACAVTYRAQWRGQEMRLSVAVTPLQGDPVDAVEDARHGLPEPLPSTLRLGWVDCDDGAHLFLAEPWLSPAPLPPARGVAEAWAHLRELALALADWHAVGRAHGALSPASLEGLAWVDRHRAALGLVAVDPVWAAPEHLEPRLGAVSPATDVFALGALFFHLVHGAPPFDGLSAGDRCAALLDRRARPSLRAAGRPVAAVVEGAIARLLAVDPAARPRDAATAYAMLGEAVLSAPEPGGPPRALPRFSVAPPEPPASPRSVPADPRVVAAACVGIVTAALAGEPLVARLFAGRAPEEVVAAAAPTSSAVVAPAKPSPISSPSQTPAAAPSPPPGPDRATLLADVLPVPKAAPRFLLDRTEVPVRLYAMCVAEGACAPTRKRGTGYRADDPLRREWLCNLHREGREGHPINCVSRPMAAAFCAWAGKRLPTDKEWALAVGDKQFPWGDGGLRCDRAVFARYGPEQGGCRKQPVGTMPVDAHPDGAGPHGHLELAGSLWEWVSSPSEHGLGLLRGGAWDGNEHVLGKAGRLEQTADNADVTLGVRCAKDL